MTFEQWVSGVQQGTEIYIKNYNNEQFLKSRAREAPGSESPGEWIIKIQIPLAPARIDGIKMSGRGALGNLIFYHNPR